MPSVGDPGSSFSHHTSFFFEPLASTRMTDDVNSSIYINESLAILFFIFRLLQTMYIDLRARAGYTGLTGTCNLKNTGDREKSYYDIFGYGMQNGVPSF